MEDLEKAVQVVFSPPAADGLGVPPETKQRAQAFLEALASSPDGWLALLQWWPHLKFVESRFWTLQTFLTSFLPRSTSAQRRTLREAVLGNILLEHYLLQGHSATTGDSAANGGSGSLLLFSTSSSFRSIPRETPGEEDVAVKNKMALLLVRLLQLDFPHDWPSAFTELRQVLDAAVRMSGRLSVPPSLSTTGGEALPEDSGDEALNRRKERILDGLEMCLRVLLVLHQEVLEDSVVGSPQTAAGESDNRRRDAEIRTALRQHFPSPSPAPSAASLEFSSSPAGQHLDTSPASFSALLLNLLQLPVVRRKGRLLSLTCDIIGRYVGYMDLLLPPQPSPERALSVAGSDISKSLQTSTEPRAPVSEDAPATEGTLIHVLLETWLVAACNEAGEAVTVFAHRKMEPETKARLLCRIGLAEALRTCAAQVAQRPELVPAFASMVSTTAAALFEACHSLYKNRSASGAAEENDRCRLGTTTKTQSPSAVSWCGSTSTGASDCEDVALMAWRRVDLLLPLVTDLFACPVPSVAFRVEPFLSLFCNKTKLQLHLPSCPMANTPGIPSALVCACPSPKLGGAERQGAVCDFVAPQDLSPFLSSLLQLVYQKIASWEPENDIEGTDDKTAPQIADGADSDDEEAEKLREYKELVSQLYKRVFLVCPSVSLAWLKDLVSSVCKRVSAAYRISSSSSSSSPSSFSLTASCPSSSPSASLPAEAAPSFPLWKEVAAMLQLLLLSSEHFRDLSRDLKDQNHVMSSCLISVLHSDALFQTCAPPQVRLLLLSAAVRFSPFFTQHPTFLPGVLQFMLGPAGINASLSDDASDTPAPNLKSTTGRLRSARQRRKMLLSRVAGRSCVSLLRFLKHTQPQVSGFGAQILQFLQSQSCLVIVAPSLPEADPAAVNARGACFGEGLAQTGAALVANKLFSVADQQMLFEAAGVLLGARSSSSNSKQQARPESLAGEARLLNGTAQPDASQGQTNEGFSVEEKRRMLRDLLQQLMGAFNLTKLSEVRTPLQAAAWAVWWARTCNAIASLSKGFSPLIFPSSAPSSPNEDAEVWKEALQVACYAAQVALSPSSFANGTGSVFLYSPFFQSIVFLLRRMLHLLHHEVIPFASVTLGLLYEALPSPLAPVGSERLLADEQARRFFLGPTSSNGTLIGAGGAGEGAAPCTPQGCGDQLASLVTHFVVTLKHRVSPPVKTGGQGLLSEDLMRNIFWRHFALWWLAVSDTPQFLRDQAELQEQLALLLCTVAKEVPSVLVASGLVGSSPLTCSAIASAVTLLAQSAAGAGDDSGASGDTGAGTVFICLLQQLQQRLPTEQATRQELAASFSEGKGVLASGLVHADMRNVFLAVLRESLQLTRHGSAELREGLNPATASGRAVAAFLLYCCCPSSATNAGAATYAIQAWTHLIQHGFQTPALFAPLREVLGLSYSSGVFTQGEIAQSEDAGQQRGDGIDLVLQVIPVREVLACTSSLLLELDVANDAQQVRVLGDVCALWRVLIHGPGKAPSSRQGADAEVHLPQLCRRMQHLIHSALTDSLFAAAVRAGIDLEHKESVYEAAKQATAPVVRSVTETTDLRANREELRQWVVVQRQQQTRQQQSRLAQMRRQRTA